VGRFTDSFWEDLHPIFGKTYICLLGSLRAATANVTQPNVASGDRIVQAGEAGEHVRCPGWLPR
jgi:hypothetical protein